MQTEGADAGTTPDTGGEGVIGETGGQAITDYL